MTVSASLCLSHGSRAEYGKTEREREREMKVEFRRLLTDEDRGPSQGNGSLVSLSPFKSVLEFVSGPEQISFSLRAGQKDGRGVGGE